MPKAGTDILDELEASLVGEYSVVFVDAADCPVFFSLAMPVHPFPHGVEPRLPCGRGLTRSESKLSALGEAAELRACLASKDLVARHGDARRDGLAHVIGENLGTGRAVDLLAQHVFLDWALAAGEPEVFGANTNGCAAWPDLDGATERGLLECIERDALALWWYGRLRCPRLPRRLLDDRAPRLSWWLQQRRRTHAFVNITSDTLVPAVVAASWEPDGSNIAMGSAAALSLPDAALSATTEMLQTELAIEVGNVAGNEELRGWLSRAVAHDLQQLAGDVSSLEPAAVEGPVAAHLIALGREVLRFDFTRAGDILHAVRIIVPSLGGMRQHKKPERIMEYLARNPALTETRTVDGLDPREPY
jgi:ribosomal protein S12 methylthiotransferase accessory factor YcaO